MKHLVSRLKIAIGVIIICNMITSLITPVSGNTVAANSTTIKLNQTKLSLRIGEKYKLILNGTKAIIKWSSNKQSVAKVSKDGIVTGIKPGHATITATFGSEQYKCNVTVLSPKLVTTKIELLYGESKQLKIKNLPINYSPSDIVYESDDEQVVTVNENGLITAINFGSVKIYITYGTYKFECKVNVSYSLQHARDSLEIDYEECGEMILCFIKNNNNFDFDIGGDLAFYNTNNDLVSLSSGSYFIGNIRTIYANDESVYFFEKPKEEYSYCKLQVDIDVPPLPNIIAKDKIEVTVTEPYEYTFKYKDNDLSDYQSDTIKLFDLNVNNLSNKRAILWAVVVLYNGDKPVNFIAFIKDLDTGFNLVKNPLYNMNDSEKIIMPAYDSYEIFYSVNSY